LFFIDKKNQSKYPPIWTKC